MNNRLLLAALPGAFFALTAIAVLAFAPDAALVAQAARALPLIALLGAGIIAWRLQQARLLSAGILILATSVAMQRGWAAPGTLPQILLAIFLPVGFALLACTRDRGFSVTRVRNQILLASAPLIVAAFFCAGRREAAVAQLSTVLIDPIYTDWSTLPQLALLTLLAALSLLAVQTVRTRHTVEAALFWLTLTTAWALGAAGEPVVRGVWLLATSLLLLASLIEIAYALAFHDELTGLPARRALHNTLSNLQAPFAIAIVDVDHFKSFNDTHGHDVGDQVLRMVAARLSEVGGGGVAFRSGGEEFTIVFAGSSKREALPHLEAVRDAVDQARFTVRKLPRPRGKNASRKRGRPRKETASLHVTISVGIAAASAKLVTPAQVIEAADKAMYRAKRDGRNRVVA